MRPSLLDILRKSGARITKCRAAIAAILDTGSAPVSVQDLSKSLARKGIRVNKTTVYRELSSLLSKNLIKEVDFLSGQKFYEVRDPDHHHHHLVCQSCSAIQCVEMHGDLDRLERQLLSKYGFNVREHVLEFFGICKKCQ